ncbi:MAG: T9SS type A sorting domain-containing protein [Bacteroidia bacterium]|nr:T9SS type A sorting domain-containing protein [Bacteroidia bacterium]MBP7728626.1 T9SS type A sorting domain-containing protein [Bacteroidia bacterium]MBP7773266.1 T9SS type A sorting domain-containing protein [Bacteroidia bacterium]
MKKSSGLLFLSSLFVVLLTLNVFAQFDEPKPNAGDPTLPDWVRLLYADQPNVKVIDAAYADYYRQHSFEKNIYTQYYKRWKRANLPFIQADGSLRKPSAREFYEESQQRMQRAASARQQSLWTPVGPVVHLRGLYNVGDPQFPISWHANVYSIDRSLSDPNTLYAGTESGGVYKTTDQGQHWSFVSGGLAVNSIRAIAVNPADPDIAYFADGRGVFRTTDGGSSWSLTGQPVFQSQSIYVDDIYINPANPNMVFLGSSQGLFRSTDGGDNYVEVLTEKCVSVLSKPGDPSTVYALQYDPTSKIAYCYKSLDSGITFTIKPTGWFEVPPADAGLIESYGGKLAVTEANPDKVYALLVGQSQAAANLQLNGYIGLYVSNDGGESWSNPHGQIGAPYNVATHPNPMTFTGDNNTYNQIYYNTTIVASQLDEQQVLFGGLSLWRSTDGGASITPVGGYTGNVPFVHPDMQTLRIYRTGTTSEEVWLSCDGGVNYSTDFFASHDSRTHGIVASEYWGFDQGWNDDILVGGRYHNGNSARNDGYSPGAHLQIDGGEASTGYVNYSPERKAAYSDIGGKIVPDNEGDVVEGYFCSQFPNEGYWTNENSRILYDLRCWNTSYLGFENSFYRSDNGGGQFTVAYQFPGTASDEVLWIEQSWADPDVFYLQQVLNGESIFWRSNDGGQTWAQVNLPLTGYRYLYFTISEENTDEVWIAYGDGPDGQKVYHTQDGGASWTNMSSAILDGQSVASIAHQYGTDGAGGGVYVAMFWGQVYYRENGMPDWIPFNTGLPAAAQPLRIVPFYRDNKLRMATRGHGIWETNLYQVSRPVADFGAERLSFSCMDNIIQFTAHAVASSTATYAWSFPGGTPATSADLSPVISYAAPGSYDVTLIVQDNGTSDTLTRTNFIAAPILSTTVPATEGFEGVLLPGWEAAPNQGSSIDWSVTGQAGGYGQSTHALYIDNYTYDLSNFRDEFRTSPIDLRGLSTAELRFDVAYAEYSGQYSDSLAVLITNDCGQTRTLVFLKGGADLATAPPFTPSVFIPAASEWRTEVIDLSAYAGDSNVTVIFENRGHYGQAIYVDNINIHDPLSSGLSDAGNQTHFILQPNPATETVQVTLQASTGEPVVIRLFDMTGKLAREISPVGASRMLSHTLDLNGLHNGVYEVVVTTRSSNESKRLVISR